VVLDGGGGTEVVGAAVVVGAAEKGTEAATGEPPTGA
jgi:hypothetical protein